MKGTWAVVLCSLLLIAAEIQGQLTSGKGRCSCIDKGSDFIQQKALGKIEVIPKSSSCDHVEIIATLKPTGEQKCLNPNSKWVRKMVTALVKKRSSQSTHRMEKS
ncbi:C-X-C motif chemokine 10-like isoform X2 [Gopherus evgoodei]|uniref:C-X-C motif chemokine 10-like isoform X1 n=1 Tax=Gopherus evgoodei TaxID=1825980 RepID=UPI0011CF5B5B|nr:C-X-C motif chemokine 10-like isoform X1 [Gopherus evgoodei]XP_030419884.1 C-X-C motif chemokine 10-like isoform X2 [Gopherus evgoodei]